MNEAELKAFTFKYNPHHKDLEDRVIKCSKYLSGLNSNACVLDAGCGKGKMV